MFKTIKKALSVHHIPFPYQHPDIQVFLKETPALVRISLVDNMKGAVRCEVEDEAGKITLLGDGVGAVGIWLRLKAQKEGGHLPEFLLENR